MKEFEKESHPNYMNDYIEEETDDICISSILVDKSLIERVMSESYLGFSSKEELDQFKNKGEIVITKSEDESYDFIFKGNYDENEALTYVNNIVDEYDSLVQESTYIKLLEKVEKENLILESEIVDNEDSIVLTLNI